MANKVKLGEAMAGDEEENPAAKDQPAAQRFSSSAPVKEKPVKLTIEITPDLHRRLKSFALLQAEDATIADIVRATIHLCDSDEPFAKKVAKEAARIKAQRRRAS